MTSLMKLCVTQCVSALIHPAQNVDIKLVVPIHPILIHSSFIIDVNENKLNMNIQKIFGI